MRLVLSIRSILLLLPSSRFLILAILGNIRRQVVLTSKVRKKPVQWPHTTESLGLTRISSNAILIFTPVIQICHTTSATPFNLHLHDGGVVLCSASNDVLHVTQSVSETRVISRANLHGELVMHTICKVSTFYLYVLCKLRSSIGACRRTIEVYLYMWFQSPCRSELGVFFGYNSEVSSTVAIICIYHQYLES